MPAPLPAKPTKRMPDIQLFGRDDSSATRAALRFFRERRVQVTFVDLKKRTIAPGELRRFVDKLGARRLLDETSKPYRDEGLAYLSTSDGALTDRMLRDARLLRLPLVRHGNEVTAGIDEDTWKAWLAKP
jgi:arsenate reductase-like glutaredoxin family protein